MLEIKNIHAGYDKKQVLFDLSLQVKAGEIVAIIGPNGAGKSTILKTVCGLLSAWDGKILFDNKDITHNQPSKNIALGITFAPQGNRVFDELSVKENLEIGGFLLSKSKLADRIEAVLEVFPILKERFKQTSGSLSGGEKQMLALGRALIPEPKLLLLDEPSLGLAPNLLHDVFQKIVEINRTMNLSVLIVEQKVREVLPISHKVYSIKLGKNAFEGKPEELINDKEKLKNLFL
jgi:ABC-type branched-subunit amino acid transport system ATPase component